MAGRYPRRARHAATPTSRVRHSLRHRSLQCERLEDRRLLAVVTVDTDRDVVDFNDGKTSLREAIFAANTVPGADEIRFDFGHDGPKTILLTQGELAIRDDLSIVGPGVGLLTIDGQLGSRLFNVFAAAGNVAFQGITLTRGQTSGDNSSAGDLLNQTYSGGAIRSVTAGLMTLDGVDVVSNGTTGVNAGGGALYVTGPLVIKQSKIRGNVASGAGAEGGGLAASGAVTIVATTFSGNRGARGGGVSSSGELTIDSSTFNGNKAVDTVAALGGAVYATGKLSVVNSTISTNAAQSTGTNSRAQGAGVWTNGDASLAHSTIVANTSSTVGTGAIAAGGGLYADQSVAETLTINHTIIGGNLTTEEQGELRLGAGVLDLRYSLIADNDGTSLAEAPIGWADAQGNLIGGARYGYIEPLLDGLEDNGGPTRTHALLPGSPAVFAGDMALTPGVGGTPEFDQRGAPYARRGGTRMAMGAVESAVAPIIVDSLADGNDGNYGPGELTLREALELANGRLGFDAVEFDPSLFAEGPQKIALSNGELRISEELNLYGPGAALLTIDASGNDAYPDRLWGGTSVVVIDDVNSRHAFKATIVGVSFTGAERGAIRSQESLVLVGVDIHDNRTSSQGDPAGGVATFELLLIASRVFRNDALRGTGAISSNGRLVIERSEVTGNGSLTPTVGAFVGAISVRSMSVFPSSVTIVDSDISGNQGSEVGGIASNGFGFYMINTNLSDNYGHRTGGAIIQAIGSEFGIWGSTIKGNSSRVNLAGIELSGYQQGIIDQTTISGNYRAGASGNGGGGVLATGSRLEVRGSTVTGNDRTGISVSGSRTVIGHSIIAGNGRLGGGDLGHGATAPTIEYSLIGNNAGSELSESPAGRPDENGNLIGGPLRGVIDPLLAPLAENGGPLLPGGARLLTHALLPGSPAIDGGDATLVAGEGETPEFDQRGAPYARVLGARIDMGAIEQAGTPFVVDNFADEFDGDYGRFDLSLREAVWLANRQPGADVIHFAGYLLSPGGATIPLELGEIVISEALTIETTPQTPISILLNRNQPMVVDENGSIQTDRAFRIDDGDAAIDSTVVMRRINVFGGGGFRDGGAIWSAEPLTLTNSMHSGSFALSGGAIWAGNDLTVDGCKFEYNSTWDDGGAIHASADAIIRNSTFAENRSVVGGAVSGRSESPLRPALLQLENNDFNRNSATLGGAVAWDEWTTVVVIGSIFTFNNVTQKDEITTPKGGALYGAGPVVIAHSTIAENRILFSSSYELNSSGIEVKIAFVTHSIIAFNDVNQVQDVTIMKGGRFSADYSIIGTGSPLPWTWYETTDARHNLVGGYMDRGRVFFAGFFPGKYAIDAGNPALTVANSPLAEFDLRGAPMRRFFGGRIDIGAYETQTAEGDFDGNGIVDGADFLRWQRGAGELIGGHASGDASGDGFIGGDDRELWKRRFGDGVAVPATDLAAMLAEEESADAWMAPVVDELPKVASDFSRLAGVTLEQTNAGVTSRAEIGELEFLKRRASRVAPSNNQKMPALHARTDPAQERGLPSWPQGTDWFAMEDSLTVGAIDEAFALEDAFEDAIALPRRR